MQVDHPDRIGRFGWVRHREEVPAGIHVPGVAARPRTRATWTGFHGRAPRVVCPSALSRAAIARSERPPARNSAIITVKSA